jgi:hypothetical protein
VLWRVTSPWAITRAEVSGDRIFLAYHCGDIVALKLTTGRTLWAKSWSERTPRTIHSTRLGVLARPFPMCSYLTCAHTPRAHMPFPHVLTPLVLTCPFHMCSHPSCSHALSTCAHTPRAHMPFPHVLTPLVLTCPFHMCSHPSCSHALSTCALPHQKWHRWGGCYSCFAWSDWLTPCTVHACFHL